jgi:hypothetical protein
VTSTDRKRIERASELSGQLAAHRATQAHFKRTSLHRVFQAYVRNTAELLSVIVAPDRDPGLAIAIMEVEQKNRTRETYYDDLFRCLHNYLSILKTLVDHTRNFLKEYQGTGFAQEYESRKAQIAGVAVVIFLQKIRNYILHYRVPPFLITHSLKGNPVVSSFRVTLNVETLLMWHDWSPAAKNFMKSHEEIDLLDCIKEYSNLISDLYEWFFRQLYVVHAVDIEEAKRLEQQFTRVMGGGS